MKLKNEIFINGFIEALKRLVNEKLPILTAYKLRKLVKEVEAKAVVYGEARMVLVEEYGKRKKLKKGEEGPAPLDVDEKGKVAIIDEEAFGKAILELLNIEEEYDCAKIKLPEDISISVNDLALLEPILEL